jgi:DNA-binding NtrC family response regulator
MPLDDLLQLRIPQRLLKEAAVDAGELYVYDRHATVRYYRVTGATSRCFTPRATPAVVSWPCCLPPLPPKDVEWLACAQGAGEHLVVPIPASTTPLGWIVTRGLPRASRAPGYRESLERLLAIAVDEMRTVMGHASPPKPPRPAVALPELIGDSAALWRVCAEIRRMAAMPLPVLIEGETGTGKDLVAWLIHDRGPRRAGPYVTLNCAAMPEALVEAELFGHRRGAFSGADRDRPGLMEAAHGGTLFLDEVGELSPAAQAKLLRAVESGEVRPVGAVKAVRTDVRLIAATNINLESAVLAGRFRRDLYYRLRVLSLYLPPLRERREDIPPLVRHVLRSVCQRFALPPLGLSREALAACMAATWPGNVRQLIHEIERAVVACEESEIGIHHLSPEFQAMKLGQGGSFWGLRRHVLEAWEQAELCRGLERTGWNVAQLARELGLSKRALFGRLARYRIARPVQEEAGRADAGALRRERVRYARPRAGR